MTDAPQARPRCREEQRRLGLAYPKSNCEECGSLIRVGWRCPHAAAPVADRPMTAPAPTPADLTAMADRLKNATDQTELVNGCHAAEAMLRALARQASGPKSDEPSLKDLLDAERELHIEDVRECWGIIDGLKAQLGALPAAPAAPVAGEDALKADADMVSDIIAAMTNYLRIEQDMHFIDRQYICGKEQAAERIRDKIVAPILAENARLQRKLDDASEFEVMAQFAGEEQARADSAEALLKEMREALRPFAKVADSLTKSAYGPAWGFNGAMIEHEDFRSARAVLASAEKATPQPASMEKPR